MTRHFRCAVLVVLVGVACQSPIERGERLYRQGDLRGAIAAWDEVKPDNSAYSAVTARRGEVQAELDRLLRRYEKRAAFREKEGKLAEAVLDYRLALKLADRPDLLAKVQTLVRELAERVEKQRAALGDALQKGKLREAARHAKALERLDPFDPAIQLEIRGVQAAAGSEVLRHLEEGKRAYAQGDRETARREFQTVLELERDNETALGYLSYLRRFEALEARRKPAPPPRSIPQEDILAEGHYRAAQQAEDGGEPVRALSEYMAALRVNSQHAGARRGLANLRRELAPRVPGLYQAGERYFLDEDLHNALRVWKELLLIEPNHPQALENVERAERILQRLEEIQAGATGD